MDAAEVYRQSLAEQIADSITELRDLDSWYDRAQIRSDPDSGYSLRPQDELMYFKHRLSIKSHIARLHKDLYGAREGRVRQLSILEELDLA